MELTEPVCCLTKLKKVWESLYLVEEAESIPDNALVDILGPFRALHPTKGDK